MPTVVVERGWRLFFYADEGNEPVHIHARKGGSECKFWLRPELGQIEEAWSYAMTPKLRKQVSQIILDHFDLILQRWTEFFGGDRNAAD
ncbi:MAG TPA: DUF4160 domain-containing protein [Pirellulales bacterium]|nr:DUF4160 domain-containing protein [Pirellulales bacterium]